MPSPSWNVDYGAGGENFIGVVVGVDVGEGMSMTLSGLLTVIPLPIALLVMWKARHLPPTSEIQGWVLAFAEMIGSWLIQIPQKN